MENLQGGDIFSDRNPFVFHWPSIDGKSSNGLGLIVWRLGTPKDRPDPITVVGHVGLKARYVVP